MIKFRETKIVLAVDPETIRRIKITCEYAQNC